MAQFLQEEKGVNPAAAFGSRLRIADFAAPAPVTPTLPTPAGPVYTSAGGQLRWNASDPNRGFVTFDAPHAQGALGFMAGRSLTLANLALSVPTDTAQFAARRRRRAATASPLPPPARSCSASSPGSRTPARCGTPTETSLDDRWGGPPTLIEPLAATVTLTVDDPGCSPRVGAG